MTRFQHGSAAVSVCLSVGVSLPSGVREHSVFHGRVVIFVVHGRVLRELIALCNQLSAHQYTCRRHNLFNARGSYPPVLRRKTAASRGERNTLSRSLLSEKTIYIHTNYM